MIGEEVSGKLITSFHYRTGPYQLYITLCLTEQTEGNPCPNCVLIKGSWPLWVSKQLSDTTKLQFCLLWQKSSVLTCLLWQRSSHIMPCLIIMDTSKYELWLHFCDWVKHSYKVNLTLYLILILHFFYKNTQKRSLQVLSKLQTDVHVQLYV